MISGRRTTRSLLSSWLLLLWASGAVPSQAQERATTLVQSILDESIIILTDKPVYYPGDTLRLAIQRADSAATATVTPVISIEGLMLEPAGRDAYQAAIPHTVTPGSYRVLLKITDADGRRFVYETNRAVAVEEYQVVEPLVNYVVVAPFEGGADQRSAITLDAEQVRALHVVFRRDSIRPETGPQFVTIRTAVQTPEGTILQTFERRVMTFRSRGTPERDRALFIQYRTAYGAYAAISTEELLQVSLPLDSLPGWSIIRVSVEPDYTIRIGAYDRSNAVTRWFRVRGPTIEIGLSLGIPKVLFDTKAADSIDYGNTSAMVRFYRVSGETGRRFPVSLGLGTYGVSSPIDVSAGRGGFAISTLLDLVELTGVRDVGFIKKLSAGLELTPFFPVERKARLLLAAQVGLKL